MCSEFTGDGYSIGLVSVGELAHRPSGTYSGEAEKHGHEDKARRKTISGYTLSTNKRRMSTMGEAGPALWELVKSGTWAIPRPRLEDTAERQTQLLAGSQHWHGASRSPHSPPSGSACDGPARATDRGSTGLLLQGS